MGDYVDIKGYEGYKINKLGQIISYKRKTPRLMTASIKGNGYLEVTLIKEKGVSKQIALHRLIAETFINNPNNYKYVNHINGNICDNRIENLEWCTSSQNSLHSIYVLKNKTYTQKVIIVDGIRFESLKKCAECYKINAKNLSGQLAKGIIPRALRNKTIEFE